MMKIEIFGSIVNARSQCPRCGYMCDETYPGEVTECRGGCGELQQFESIKQSEDIKFIEGWKYEFLENRCEYWKDGKVFFETSMYAIKDLTSRFNYKSIDQACCKKLNNYKNMIRNKIS